METKSILWDGLSMRERAAYIRDAVSRGIFDIDNIRLEYNEFKKGGSKKPDANILKQTFLNSLELSLDGYSRYATPEWRKLLTDLAFLESSYNANALNSIGAKGYFQLMPANRSQNWNTPIQLFHEMYKLTDANMLELKNRMTPNDYKLAQLLGIDIYGLIAGSHLGGVKNALTALRGGKNAKDSNGSSVLSYMRRFSQVPSRNLIKADNIYDKPIIMPNDNTRVVKFTNPDLQLYNNLLKVASPTIVSNQIPSLAQELNQVIQEPIAFEGAIPEVVVTPNRQRYIIPNEEILSLILGLVKPYTPIEVPKPLTATERLKLLNDNRVTLLLKDLENSIIRNNLLDIQNPDKLRKDAEDIRFYRNMNAYGGNLYPIGGKMITVNRGDRVGTDLCAAWSNGLLRDNGYLISGDAWHLNDVDNIFNGYDGLERPENYDLPLVKQYNHNATDNVFRNFDSKTLDVNKPYVVNMFYNDSPSLENAYNNGKGVTGTHTGLLTYDEPTLKWWVTHNIHGNIHLEPFIDLQNSKGKYGVTAIYEPRKANLWNRTKGLLGFADGGLMNPIEYMHLRFPITELLDVHPLFDSGFTPRDIGDFGDIEYMLARYDNLPYYNNYSKPDSLKGKSVIVYNDRLGEGTNEAIALDALSHGLRELDNIWRELYIPTLLSAFREDANYFADLEGIPLEYRQEYIDEFIDGKIRDMVVKDSLRKLLNYLPKQSLILEYRSMTPELQNALTEAYSYIFPTLLDEIVVNGKRK